jgi:hypothetical protein
VNTIIDATMGKILDAGSLITNNSIVNTIIDATMGKILDAGSLMLDK